MERVDLVVEEQGCRKDVHAGRRGRVYLRLTMVPYGIPKVADARSISDRSMGDDTSGLDASPC